MIRFNIIGFKKTDSGGPRWGDCTIIDDGKNHLVIDGYCGIGTTRLLERLKKLKIKSPYLFISHAHYDHYHGIRKIIGDTYFTPKALYCYDPKTLESGLRNNRGSNAVRSDISTLKAIISEAKKRGIPVKYINHGDKLTFGDIKFNVYRKQPAVVENDDTEGWSYINDGSLVFYFPDLRYLTSGDGSECIGQLCKDNGLKPVMLKIPHHGNNCPRTQATILWNLGCRYCWDNDISPNYTDFLMTGREDCIGVGMKYFSCIGDLNMIFFGKRAVIYKGGTITRYACDYNGKPALKDADLDIVKAVLKGSMGTGDARITNLLDAGYNYGLVQKQVNEIVNLVKG